MAEYQQLVEYLIANEITIATAESCTGGLIAKLITDVPGSSTVFIGGVVCYSNEMKLKWLGVKQKSLEQFGAVSEQAVEQMLAGIVAETHSELAVAVSGIAGPTGGTAEKPVGTVIIGVVFQQQKIVRKYHFQGSRDGVRLNSALMVAQLIRNLLNISHEE